MKRPRRRVAYVSRSVTAGIMAIWLDERPSGEAGQRDPDAWAPCATGDPAAAERLAVIAKAPGAELSVIHDGPANRWAKTCAERRARDAKADRAIATVTQSLFAIDPELETAGRNEAYVRARHLK